MLEVEGPLTCPQPQPESTNEVVIQSVMIPHCDLHAGLPEVLRSEAVVHHGVVEHGVRCPLHHPGLLSTFPACIRKYGAAAEAGK